MPRADARRRRQSRFLENLAEGESALRNIFPCNIVTLVKELVFDPQAYS
jgi:hypothetical protein